jgi:steroid delta-isomerase-like uncharacterized protein
MVGSTTLGETAELTQTEQRNLRAVTEVLQYWNTQNAEQVVTFYDEQITWRNVAMEEVYQGKQEVHAFLVRLFTAFPDLTFDVTYKIARGVNVSEQWCMRGTHRGAFFGVPATGRSVVIPGISMVEMRDGKFLRDEFYFDAGGVMRQLGLLPPLSVSQTALGRGALWLVVHRRRVAPSLAGAGLVGLALRLLRRRR